MKLERLQQILVSHFTRTPRMQVEDIYKLLHQAAMGSEHAIHDEQSARENLRRELAGMGEGPNDPWLDPISPDGQIARVHLRPYLHAGKDPENLLCAFIRTAQEWQGSTTMLREFGAVASGFLKAEPGSIRAEDFEGFFIKMEESGFPAVHHSEQYQNLYRPAYRVVARKYLEAQ